MHGSTLCGQGHPDSVSRVGGASEENRYSPPVALGFCTKRHFLRRFVCLMFACSAATVFGAFSFQALGKCPLLPTYRHGMRATVHA